MICLICEKEILHLDNCPENVNDAGELDASFCYGSRHDQIGDYAGEPQNELAKLLQCKIVKAYICDDCFERKMKCFEGYNVEHKSTVVRVV